LLEEFRVSLFAQSLGTAAPVSAKRLEQHWRRALELPLSPTRPQRALR
jgi:ATP-dependent helicase HrpA